MHLTAAIIGKEPLMDFKRMQDPDFVKAQLEKDKILFYHKTRAALDDDLFAYLQKNTKPILIVRDPKDALLSLCFMRRTNSMTTQAMEKFILEDVTLPTKGKYYENKIEMWKDHINGWLGALKNPLVIRYENYLTAYDKQVKQIADYLQIEVPKKKPELKEVKMSRKGIIGDHKNHFTGAFIEMINEKCKDEIKLIDKYLL